MLTIITHVVALLIGGGAGWFGHKKYGVVVATDAAKVASKIS